MIQGLDYPSQAYFCVSKNMTIFLPIRLNNGVGAQVNRLTETVLFEYTQHMFQLKNKEPIS